MKRLVSTDTLATLCLLLAIVVASAGFGAHAQTRTQYAGQPYTQAGTALLAFSHQGALPAGETAVSRFDYDPAKFPAGVSFYEKWADHYQWGVRGWSSAQWNRYYGSGTRPSKPYPSVPINQIKALTLDYALRITGNANALVDWFVTEKPDDMTTIVAEIEVLPNPSPSGLAWARAGKSLGTVGPWTVTYMVSGNTTIYFFVPTNGVRNSGQIDLRATMLWLGGTARPLNGKGYFNGFGLGIEPVSGLSTLTIDKMAVTYERK